MPSGNQTDGRYAFVCGQFTGTVTSVAVEVGSNRSAQLTPGRYRMVSTVDCFVKQGGSTVTATSDHFPIFAEQTHYFAVGGGNDDFVAVIRDSADGSLRIQRL